MIKKLRILIMETKKIIIILIITCIIVAGATYILTDNTPINKTQAKQHNKYYRKYYNKH